MRIPINDSNDDVQEIIAAGHTPGGDITEPQDAAAVADASQAVRLDDEAMQEQQAAGEVESQTRDLKPTPGNPDEGLPHGDTAADLEDGTDATTAPGPEAVEDTTSTRAATEADDRYLRLAADFENYKRQAQRREKEVRDRANISFIEELLPVLDNFERALDAARNAKDIESLRVGVEFIAQQLQGALRNQGVDIIEAAGKPFDPLHHEAIQEVKDSGQPEGTVVDEAQRGYKFKGQVLRPSMVRVAG